MPNIDDLSVGIKSNVTSATNSIDKLIKRLGVLSSSLGQVNTNGFYQMAQGINQIEVATKNLTSDSATKLANLSLSIRKFGSATANAATANIPQLASSISTLANTMNTIGAFNFNADGVNQFASAISKLGGVKVGDAITNLPYLGTVIEQLSKDISGLSANSDSVSNLTQLATALSRIGGKAVTNSISNIPKLTNALMQMFTTLSKAPQVNQSVIRLTESIANLASQGSKVGTASRSMTTGLHSFNSSAKSANKSAHSLASAIGKLYAKYWLLFRLFSRFGKAIDFASDLKEVQNVIDVSFGNYKNVIEDFSKTSIQDYGISELTAKKMAGRFQAMGTAVGFSQEKMAKMSTTLTGLAADMGSFYNVEAEQVAESLQSVFTGTTKPLRAYGIDLTNATLQEWLMSKGIDANVKSMSQAEKVMLRYNYVIEHTRNAQGDFQRTQDTWANQIRMLKQNFQALGGVIGQNFIYALKPVVSALNTVMLKLIQFAKVVSESLGTIFGWKYEDSTGGIVNDLETGADFAEDLGDGLGSAANNAKKLHQQLQGFDELNVLTTPQDTGKGGGGGGGIGGYDVPAASGGQWTKIDDAEKFFTSDLDTLYKLGDHISTTIKDQLQSIDWNEVYQGAKDWGAGLASFLNGYINPEMFYETGKAVAGSINTAVYFAISFADNFDFKNLGDAWAQRFNGFFGELDTAALAEAISKWIKGALTTVTTFFTNTDFELIGRKVGEFITNIDWSGIVIDLAKLAKAVLGAIVSALKGLAEDPNAMLEIGGILALWFGSQAVIGKISTAISGAVASATSSSVVTAGVTASGASLGTYLAVGLVTAFIAYGVGEKIDKYLHDHGLAIDDLFTGDDTNESKKVWDKVDQYAADYSKSYQDLVNSGYYTDATLADENAEAQFNATRNKMLNISKQMQNLAKTMTWGEFKQTNLYNGALEQLFGGDENALKKQYEALRNTFDNLANLPTTAALAYSKAGVNFSKTSNTVSKAQKISTTAILAMEKAGVEFDKTTGKVTNSLTNNISTTSKGFETSTKSITDNIGGAKNAVNALHNSATSDMNNMTSKAVSFGSQYGNAMSSTFLGVCDIGSVQMNNLNSNVGKSLSGLQGNSTNTMSNVSKTFSTGFSGISNNVTTTTNGINNTFSNGLSNLHTNTTSKLNSLNNSVSNSMSTMTSNTNQNMKTFVSTFNDSFDNVNSGASSKLSNISKTVSSSVNAATNILKENKRTWYDDAWFVAEGAYDGIKKKLTNSSAQGGSMLDVVSGGIGSATDIIKRNKKSWYDPGWYMVDGMAKGIDRKWNQNSTEGGSLVNFVVSLCTTLTNAVRSALGINSPSRVWRDQIGQWLPPGIGVGIERATPALLSDIDTLGRTVTEEMNGALTLATPNGISSNFDFGVSNIFEHEYGANSSVSSNIADGITRGMYSAQAEQNSLLREQNELLYQILQKDAVSTDDLYNVVVKKNRESFNRTGDNLLLI